MLSISDEIKQLKPGIIRDKGLLVRINRQILQTTGLKSFDFSFPCQHGNFTCSHKDIVFKMDKKYYYINECNFKTEEYLKYAYGLRLRYVDGCFNPYLAKI
jgi:hypothetical protein